MRKVCLLIPVFIFFATISFAQQGKNGAVTISVNTTVNEYTTLTTNANAGSDSIIVSNNTLNTHHRFSTSLSPGDLVMIIQIQGATINGTATDSTWGAVTNYNNCGLYEFDQVAGVSGTTIIHLKCPLQNNYTASGNVEVVRVPRYSSLTINSNDTVTCDAWNGSVGGIVAVEVSGNTVINTNGAISAIADGFRGGVKQDNNAVNATYGFASETPDTGAQKGESIAGDQAYYNTAFGGEWGRASAANGGGGGDNWNAGGGGGANAGNSNDWTGNGNPDTSTNTDYKEAWNLEYPGFANSTSSGGGRGGYTISYYEEDPLSTGPGNPLWGGNSNRTNVGGKGGRPLDYSTGRLFLGGGGGSGQEDNTSGGSGGNGGGLIYLLSYGTISGSGSILSNGQHGGGDSASALGDGSGGGGGGGTVIVSSVGDISTTISIYANGASGGNQVDVFGGFFYEVEGPGGGGGGGYIATSNGGMVTQALGGNNGVSKQPAMAAFPPDGATKGGDGMDTVVPYCFPQIGVINGSVSVCSGELVTYSVPVVSCGGVPVFTWNVPLGWSESTITDSSVTVTTGDTGGIITFSMTTGDCSASDTATIMVTVNPSPQLITAPQDTVFCTGQSATIYVVGGGTGFVWTPGMGILDSTASGDTVVVSPSITTTYSITGIDSAGCAASGSAVVTVIPSPNTPTFHQHGDTLISSSVHDNQWYRNDTLLTNDTSQYLIITALGEYWVIVNNEVNGCSTASDSANISQITGINQLTAESGQVTIYPNPTSNLLTIESVQWTVENIEITNVLGQSLLKVPGIYSDKIGGGFRGEIDLSAFPSGMYFITVITDTTRTVVKVVKE